MPVTADAAPDGSRLGLAALALRAISETPLAGQGFGAAAEAVRLHGGVGEDMPVPADADTLNAYLQIALGAGAVAAGAALGVLIWLVLACARFMRAGEEDAIYTGAAVGTTVVVACHAALSPAAQAPAVAFLYAAVLGAGAARAFNPGIASTPARETGTQQEPAAEMISK